MPSEKKIKSKETDSSPGDWENIRLLTEKDLEDLLSDKNKMDLELERKMSELKKGQTVLVIVQPENYAESRMGLIRRFAGKKKMDGVFVTVNKPYRKITEEAENEKIDITKMRFIDLISKTTDSVEEGDGGTGSKVDFLESTGDLTELVMACEKRIGEISGDKFFVLDSVSALLVYNESDAVEKFIHTMINKISREKAQGILLIIESREFEGAIQTLSQFCDKVVKIL
ncbi:MAG: ATPase domain-containing protein [Candidatus Diapherotrites archaeon]